MSDQKVMNRWIVVVGAILIQLALGAIYAWSVFTPGLTAKDGVYKFDAVQASRIFSAGLASFALVMVFAGRLQARIGPRKVAILGGLVLGLGYVLGAFLGTSYPTQLLFIGIVGGAGIGLAYVVPIAVGVKWFPDKKGVVSGLAVAGFGFGATIWVKLAGSWFGGLLNTTHVFNLPGVQSVFFIYGIAFAALVLLGSIVMVNPPEGYTPAGWVPPAPDARKGSDGSTSLTSKEMLATPQFYMIFMTFVLSALAGLMVIYCIKLFGIDALQASGAVQAGTAADGTPIEAAKVASAIAGTAMAWYAILNGLGRIVWGTVSEKIGRKMATFLMCAIQGVIMLAFFKLGASPLGLIVGACIIGFNFGGNFALFPATTADLFGNKTVGINYPLVFLAYGIAGIAGPEIAGYYKKTSAGDVNAWLTPFIIAGVGCLVAAVIAAMLRPPRAVAVVPADEADARKPSESTTRKAPAPAEPPASEMATRKAEQPSALATEGLAEAQVPPEEMPAEGEDADKPADG